MGVLQILADAVMFTTTIAVWKTGATLMAATEVTPQLSLARNAATNKSQSGGLRFEDRRFYSARSQPSKGKSRQSFTKPGMISCCARPDRPTGEEPRFPYPGAAHPVYVAYA
jgi:hypothetical protein